jgi:hypothetical protein
LKIISLAIENYEWHETIIVPSLISPPPTFVKFGAAFVLSFNFENKVNVPVKMWRHNQEAVRKFPGCERTKDAATNFPIQEENMEREAV